MRSPHRFVDQKLTLAEFTDEILVACPRCGKRAAVRPESPDNEMFGARRLVCGSCGLAQSRRAKRVTLGAPVDPYFGGPLWLQHAWGRRVVWAYNARHLDYIESFVRAELRSHSRTNPGCSNCSLISRLPRWMKDASNREHLLGIFAMLRDRLSG